MWGDQEQRGGCEVQETQERGHATVIQKNEVYRRMGRPDVEEKTERTIIAYLLCS